MVIYGEHVREMQYGLDQLLHAQVSQDVTGLVLVFSLFLANSRGWGSLEMRLASVHAKCSLLCMYLFQLFGGLFSSL